MKENHKILNKHKPLRSKAVNYIEVKQRALWAMLDLCQTLDPTLAKFHTGPLNKASLFYKWRKYCVGPKSLVCKHVLKSPEKQRLLDDKNYLEYFNSLCIGESI